MKLFITLIAILFASASFAQPQFIAKGKIEFEKKVNLHKQLDNDEDGTWREMMKKAVPPIKTNYFDLYFNGQKTVFKPGRENVGGQKVPEWIDGPANDNIVFTDLQQQQFTSQKAVFEQVFNITDTITKLDWKITADTRMIAGFECRKATTILMDSVFVFAFYTDQITTTGGPESLNALPGMILGVAIPRMNTTWFATKLELYDVKDQELVAPKKGKKTNLSNLNQVLQGAMKNWGKWRDKNMWQIII
ncbi:GLPGLI family protein [Aridibaculum aurantiacum]|uniref:GLPGLI family protein n=1 Tax=Aridibaculum aurantiacum TaxID=2810307 RepID=UPI001A9638BD|nr:GLPGLI family protein [Aridibaculum aurantiacum]